MEKCFPRGGKSSDRSLLNPLLFSSKRNVNGKKIATKSSDSEENYQIDEIFWSQSLTDSTCEVGLLCLACIQNFIGSGFSLQMPGKVRAVLPISAISEPLAKMAQSDNSDHERAFSLESLFKLSDLICVKVIGKVECVLPSGKIDKHWRVSSNPVHVNGHLAPGSLRQRTVIAAAIHSREEKGYLLDLGFKNVLGFMPFDLCDGESLPVGKVLLCSVADERPEEKRVICVRPLSRLLTESDSHELPVDFPPMLLMPGLAVKASVLRTWKHGLLVHLPFNQIAYVSPSQLCHPSDNVGKHRAGSFLNIMVTFCMPQSTILGVSAKDSLLYRASFDAGYPGLSKSQICYGTVCDSGKFGVTFMMEDQFYAQCPTKRLRQKYISNIAKYYKVGSRHKMRIVGLCGLYLSYFVSCRLETLKQPFSSLDETIVGSVVKCTVAYTTEDHVFVKLYKTFNGVIAKMHCSDAPVDAVNQRKFSVGSEHTVRILGVDLEANRLLLTAKKSLIRSKLPPLVECTERIVYQTYDGYIAKFCPSGILVAFYNNVRGLLPKAALVDAGILQAPQEVYFVGEVVRVVVDRVDHTNNEVHLVLPGIAVESKSVTAESGSLKHPVLHKQSYQPDFRVHAGEVIAVESSGLRVRLENNVVGFVPKEHLTDSLFMSDQLLTKYKNGDSVTGLVIVKDGPSPLITMKPVIVQAVADGVAPKTYSHINVGSLAYGYVARHNELHGFFVDFPGQMSAICVSSSFKCNLPLESALGVSVVARIHKVDSAKKRMSVNMDIMNSLTEGLGTSFKLLRKYLAELETVRLCSGATGLIDFRISQICNVRVVACHERLLQCVVVNSTVQAIVMACHMEGAASNYEIGSEHPAVILFIDYKDEILEVAIRSKLVRKCQRISGKVAADIVRPKQEFNAQILLIKSNLILLSLSGHGSGLICYMPARLHYNDFGVEASKYRVGQTLKVFVQGFLDDRVLVGSVLNRLVYGKMKSKVLILHGDTAVPLGAVLKQRCISLSPFSVYSAVVTGSDGYYLKLLIAGRHKGRAFITELKDNVEDGSFPLRAFPEGTLVTVKVIHLKAFQSTTRKKWPRARRTRIAYCTLKESKIFARNNAKSIIGYQEKFNKGERVSAVLIECRNGNFHVQVNPVWKGTVEKFCLGRSADEVQTALNCFKPGQVRYFYVVGVQQNDHHLTLCTYANWNFVVQAGKLTVAEVACVKTTAMARFNLVGGCSGVAYLSDMADDYEQVTVVLQLLEKNKFVDVCPILNKGNKRWLVSLRRSVCYGDTTTLKDPLISSADHASPGTVCRGFIREVTCAHLQIALGYNVFGCVPIERVSVYRIDNLCKVFHPGTLVTVAVMQTPEIGMESTNDQKPMLSLSMLQMDTGIDDQLPEAFRSKRKHDNDQCQNANLRSDKSTDKCSWFSVEEPSSKKRVTIKSNVSASSDEEKMDTVADSFMWNPGLFSLDKLLGVSLTDVPVSPNDRVKVSEEKEENCTELETNTGIAEEAENNEDLLKSVDNANILVNDVLEEKQILERELKLLDPDKALHSVQDFDRALFASPNSSALWTRYIAYFLELNDLDRARAVGRKALKTILTTYETERFNIWMALLNLENEFGSQDSMDKIVAEALEVNDHFLVYSHLLKIYEKSHKIEQGDLLVNELLNKFRSEYACWIMVCQYYMKTGRTDLARTTMERSFKSMPTSVHVDLMSRFAQMEYNCQGDPDRGCTLFEKILNEKPKRCDIWHVYVDLTAKYRSIQEARLILERVTSMKMSARKMRSFYKKWVELEMRYGTEADVEKVKLKATEYVNGISVAEWKGCS
uniref:S1 motif domain-containing protein n=1 Tax=Trichuris muris TaxID=70415 RepID=A0A5S6QFY1_TRIMR